MSKILNYLKYPIKLLLRKKVAEYKKIIFALQFLYENTAPKSRREGAIYKTAWIQMEQMLLISKYQSFVNKWEIKTKDNK